MARVDIYLYLCKTAHIKVERVKNMFCPNCGKELAEDVKFCPECGYNVKNIDQITPVQIENGSDKVCCSKCGSTDIQIGQRGYNDNAIGCGCLLAFLGFFTFGISWIVLIIIALCGFTGSGESVWICKKCGYKWEVKDGKEIAIKTNSDFKQVEKAADGCSKSLWHLIWIILVIVLIGGCTGLIKPNPPEPTKSYDEMTSEEKQKTWEDVGNFMDKVNERNHKMFPSSF